MIYQSKRRKLLLLWLQLLSRHGDQQPSRYLLIRPETPHHHFMDKIALFTQILEQNPTDAFTRYGLAMAYAAEGNTDAALAEFNTLIGHNPDYVPAYQMSAQILLKLGRTEETAARLHEGIAAANRTHNQHALAEMEAMRDEIS